MASSVSKVPLFQNIVKRSYAVAAAPKAAGCSGKLEVSTISNKAVIASLGCEPKSLVKVAVAFRAGSRYESPDNYGVSHILRSSAGLSTACASSFSICRNLQQLGANLTTTSDRETVVYLLESNCENIHESLQYLKKAISGQEFRPWELSDNTPRVKLELASIPPQAKVVDLIHKAAYRSGLGNSIFVKDYNIKKISTETLQHYVASNFSGDRAAIAGCGIPHNVLSSFGESLKLSSGSGASNPKTKYSGGEIRLEKNLPLTHTIIAAEAAALSAPEALAFAVLRFALGAGPSVKRGAGSGPLSKVTGFSTSAQALSAAHSDTGIFGVYVVSKPEDSKQALEDVVKALKSGVSDDDVSRAKAQLRAAILYSADTCQGIVEDLVGQGALNGSPKSPSELAAEVGNISVQQVKQALSQVQSGKKSLATIGRIYCVPHLDELN